MDWTGLPVDGRLGALNASMLVPYAKQKAEGRTVCRLCAVCDVAAQPEVNATKDVRKAGEGAYNFRILATPWGRVLAARGAMSVRIRPGMDRGISWHYEWVKCWPEFTVITRMRHT